MIDRMNSDMRMKNFRANRMGNYRLVIASSLVPFILIYLTYGVKTM